MTFAAGQSGNPGGRVKDKPWSEALRIVANETDAEGKKKLRKLAEKTYEMAMAGELGAIQEFGNRLEGKPKQVIEGDNDDGALVVKIIRLAAESDKP